MSFTELPSGARLRSEHHVEKYFHLELYNRRVDGAWAFKIVFLTPSEQSNRLCVLPRATPTVSVSGDGRATAGRLGVSAGLL